MKDEFTTRLVDILLQSNQWTQKLALGIHRSDYMLHNNEDLKQIEINTISSGFLGLTTLVPGLQNFALKTFVQQGTLEPLSNTFPVYNSPVDAFCELFDIATDKYCELRNVDKKDIVILMVTQKGERNSVDQRWLQFRLFETKGIHIIRRSLDYIAQNGFIDKDKQGALIVDGKEIAITYFRAGYTPDDYPTEVEWDGRKLIENSFSVKCPNIPYHLVGTKKIQQVLGESGVLEKFLTPEEADFVRSSFADMYGLESEDLDDIKEMVYKSPESFVMKPQREGGGNLLSGDEMVEVLKKGENLSDYILMKRIDPKPHKTLTFSVKRSPDPLQLEDTICELGVYGFVLANGEELIVNNAGGYLLRSKASHVEDGGVAAGRALMDSPLLE